jgi:hypothetical protein
MLANLLKKIPQKYLLAIIQTLILKCFELFISKRYEKIYNRFDTPNLDSLKLAVNLFSKTQYLNYPKSNYLRLAK